MVRPVTIPGPAGGLRHSIVVPTYQRRDLVTRVVSALFVQTRPPLEVVVVVDGSTDGTADALRALGGQRADVALRVVEQENSGASRARNEGARLARGDLVLFLDDDMIAAPDLLDRLHSAHADGADAVLGHIPLAAGSPPSFLARGLEEWARTRYERLLASGGALTPADLLTGQLSVRRDVFESLGGFDERFTEGGAFGGEDTDFGRRLFDTEHRVVFAPDAVSHQHYTVTPRAYLRQWHDAGAADVAYLRKHPRDFAEVYASKRPGRRSNRLVVRPLARVPGVRDLVASGARAVALTLSTRRPDDPRTERLFFKARDLEYWRGAAAAGGMPDRSSCRVLCYHAVRDLSGADRIDQYGVPPAGFARQLRMLRRAGFRFVSLEEVLRVLHGTGGLPRRAVLVTFDDCYRDLLEAGLPVLLEQRVPAAAFAVAGRVGATNAWDTAFGAPELRLLDASGLRALQDAGVEIGVHGSTHVPLPGVTREPQALARETSGATAALSGLGLHPLRTFAFPHGEHDAAARAAVADAGLQAAFTVTPGILRRGGDRYQLPRIEVLRADGAGARLLVKVLVAGRLPRLDGRTRLRRARRRIGRLRRRRRS